MKRNIMTEHTIKAILERSARIKQQMIGVCADTADEAAQLIAASMLAGGKLMLCGNGGSAGDAQHIAGEFVATLDHHRPRPGLPALALTTDTSFLTAYANDFGFCDVFARQVQALGIAGDVLIGLSTSGNSENVIAAAKMAKVKNIKMIAMTGEGGGKLAEYADLHIAVPSSITMHIQECHMALGHAITARIEDIIAEAQA